MALVRRGKQHSSNAHGFFSCVIQGPLMLSSASVSQSGLPGRLAMRTRHVLAERPLCLEVLVALQAGQLDRPIALAVFITRGL
jgi:hypothetical protein